MPVGAGQLCVNGVAADACPATQELCGTGCATIASDPANCGACDNRCVAGHLCVTGVCQ